MKKMLMSVLLCMSVFFVFGCSGNNVDENLETEEQYYEEIDDMNDVDDIDFTDEDIDEEYIEEDYVDENGNKEEIVVEQIEENN